MELLASKRSEKGIFMDLLHTMESYQSLLRKYPLSDAGTAWSSSCQAFPGINDVNLFISNFLVALMQKCNLLLDDETVKAYLGPCGPC